MSSQKAVDPSESSEEPVLRAEGVSKSFGTVQAVDDVSLELGENEVVALVGDNGAGKSTLLSSLVGLQGIDEGEISYRTGTTLTPGNNREVLGDEVGIVHQDMALVGLRPVFENVFIGRQVKKEYLGGLLKISDKKAMRQECERILDELGFDIPVNKKVRLLSGGERQILAFARAIYSDPPILVLDEPFTALSEDIMNQLIETINELRKDHSIMLVSHNLEMVRELADRILVMRRGNKVAELTGEEIERKDILKLMIG